MTEEAAKFWKTVQAHVAELEAQVSPVQLNELRIEAQRDLETSDDVIIALDAIWYLFRTMERIAQ